MHYLEQFSYLFDNAKTPFITQNLEKNNLAFEPRKKFTKVQWYFTTPPSFTAVHSSKVEEF